MIETYGFSKHNSATHPIRNLFLYQMFLQIMSIGN